MSNSTTGDTGARSGPGNLPETEVAYNSGSEDMDVLMNTSFDPMLTCIRPGEMSGPEDASTDTDASSYDSVARVVYENARATARVNCAGKTDSISTSPEGVGSASSSVSSPSRPILELLSETGKKIMFIRHAEDELYNRRDCAERFSDWHSNAVREQSEEEGATIDPCLTEHGILELTTGLQDETERRELNQIGYGGVQGGLGSHVREFSPQLIVSSPMSRSIQSALVAFDWSTAPVVLHPGLKEIKQDYTKGGTLPKGKPGARCLPLSYLKNAMAKHPRSSGGKTDFSVMEEALDGVDDWFDPNETHETMCEQLNMACEFLLNRPEERIAVLTHGGVLRKILNLVVGACVSPLYSRFCIFLLFLKAWLSKLPQVVCSHCGSASYLCCVVAADGDDVAAAAAPCVIYF